MNFLHAVLMRARGELDGIRPRRDLHASWSSDPEATPDIARQPMAEASRPAIVPAKPDVDISGNVTAATTADGRADRRDTSVPRDENIASVAPLLSATATPSHSAPAIRDAPSTTPSVTNRTPGEAPGQGAPRRAKAAPPAVAAHEQPHAVRAEAHVEIHIGKLEIIAPAAPRPSESARANKVPKPLSLSDYLDARSRQR